MDTGRAGTWRFEGLTTLLPVYDELEDGSEIVCREHRSRTVRKIRQLVRKSIVRPRRRKDKEPDSEPETETGV